MKDPVSDPAINFVNRIDRSKLLQREMAPLDHRFRDALHPRRIQKTVRTARARTHFEHQESYPSRMFGYMLRQFVT
jgi:hypothetical protein